MFRNSEHLGSRSWYATFIWMLIITVLWIVAWVIASAIPVFNNLLGLIVSFPLPHPLAWFTPPLTGAERTVRELVYM